MTEKERYTHNILGSVFKDGKLFALTQGESQAITLCIELNELNEENKQLKIQNKQTTEILENGGVILTKQQLTSIIEMKNNEESYEIRHLKTTNAKLKDEIKALKKENERLKSELFEAEKDYILETYADNPIRRDEKIGALEKEFDLE